MNNLVRILHKKDLTQSELARAANLTPAHISLIAQDKMRPNVGTAVKISTALGVPVEEIWPLENDSGMTPDSDDPDIKSPSGNGGGTDRNSTMSA